VSSNDSMHENKDQLWALVRAVRDISSDVMERGKRITGSIGSTLFANADFGSFAFGTLRGARFHMMLRKCDARLFTVSLKCNLYFIQPIYFIPMV